MENYEISFSPTRVLMQDFTGVPAVADLAAMRDALKKQGIEAGDKVKIATRRGKVEVKVRFDRNVPNNVIFFPFTFKAAPANVLTNPKLDPFGKIPEFKYCAAKMEKIQKPSISYK